jgi:hypothetical protein
VSEPVEPYVKATSPTPVRARSGGELLPGHVEGWRGDRLYVRYRTPMGSHFKWLPAGAVEHHEGPMTKRCAAPPPPCSMTLRARGPGWSDRWPGRCRPAASVSRSAAQLPQGRADRRAPRHHPAEPAQAGSTARRHRRVAMSAVRLQDPAGHAGHRAQGGGYRRSHPAFCLFRLCHPPRMVSPFDGPTRRGYRRLTREAARSLGAHEEDPGSSRGCTPACPVRDCRRSTAHACRVLASAGVRVLRYDGAGRGAGP